jgi:hypothetical protein
MRIFDRLRTLKRLSGRVSKWTFMRRSKSTDMAPNHTMLARRRLRLLVPDGGGEAV